MGRITQSLFRKKRKKESWLKYLMAVLHLWLGLLSALIVFVVALSGSIYAYKQQLTDWANRSAAFIDPPATPALSADSLLAQFEKTHGQATWVKVYSDVSRSLVISSMTKGDKGVTAYYHPHTGQQLGLQKEEWNRFFDTMLRLHRFLLLGDTGKLINGIAILIFVFLLLSGLVLWFPKSVAKLKDALRVEWRTTFYRLVYDLHNTLGFYATILLLLMALTGLYTSFHWMKNLMIVGLGGHSIVISEDNQALQDDLSKAFKVVLNNLEQEATQAQQATWSLQSVMDQTNASLPNEGVLTIQLPGDQVKYIRVTKVHTGRFFETPDRIDFSPSGEVRTVTKFNTLPLAEQFKAIVKPLHTGELMGLTGIIVFSIVSLIACSLPITGIIIWVKKL